VTRLLIAVACAAVVAPVVSGKQERPVFRSRTSMVSVDVSVRAGNRPVGGLTAADFVLTDNGVPQVVEIVDRAAVPIDLTLVVDVSGSTAGRLAQYRSSVREIAALLRGEDQLRVIGFSEQVVEVSPLQSATNPPPVDRLQTGRLTALNDGLIAALVREVALDRRHLIVGFTDGMDTFSAVDTAKVVEVARRADAVLHLAISSPSGGGPPIPPGGILSPPRPVVTGARTGFAAERDAMQLLESAAIATGGQRLSTGFGGTLVGAFERAFENFRSSYVLRYRPTGVPLEGWHDIDVTVPRSKSYRIRARSGYFGG
jgi:VWFA-related protein